MSSAKKPGLDLMIKNYRPVSNLCFLSNLVERCMLRQLVHHCNTNSLVPDSNQYTGEITAWRLAL